MSYAFDMGKAAFRADKGRSPILDSEFMSYLKLKENMWHDKILKEWLSGWDYANIKQHVIRDLK